MNGVAWLGGGGSAPLVIGIIVQYQSLGLAIALASLVCVLGAGLFLTGIFLFARKDAEKMRAEVWAAADRA
jgi:hypothetical protein